MTDTNAERRPRLWKATDMAPAQPSRFVPVTDPDLDPKLWRLALGISCPVCPAKPHEPCLTPGSVIVGYHDSRALKATRRHENRRAR